MTRLKSWLLSTPGALLTVTVLTLIVLAESIFPPWAPYFYVYAGLAIAIPLLLKAFAFGNFRQVMAASWRVTLGIFLLDLVWERGICTWLYQRILTAQGVSTNPYYSLDAAINKMFESVTIRTSFSLDAAQLLFAAFMLLWAPVGEELLYRGYLFATLRKRRGFWLAALVSAAFFGIRHATHFFYLWPDVPLVAAVFWALTAFVPGIFCAYLYEKTRSLYPPMIEHFLINLVGFL